MNLSPDVLKHDLRKSIEDLKKLGSGIRSDLRTKGADARRQWKHFLEPQLASVEKLARDVQAASHDAVARTSAAFNVFRASLRETSPTSARSAAALKTPRTIKASRKARSKPRSAKTARPS